MNSELTNIMMSRAQGLVELSTCKRMVIRLQVTDYLKLLFLSCFWPLTDNKTSNICIDLGEGKTGLGGEGLGGSN